MVEWAWPPRNRPLCPSSSADNVCTNLSHGNVALLQYSQEAPRVSHAARNSLGRRRYVNLVHTLLQNDGPLLTLVQAAVCRDAASDMCGGAGGRCSLVRTAVVAPQLLLAVTTEPSGVEELVWRPPCAVLLGATATCTAHFTNITAVDTYLHCHPPLGKLATQ